MSLVMLRFFLLWMLAMLTSCHSNAAEFSSLAPRAGEVDDHACGVDSLHHSRKQQGRAQAAAKPSSALSILWKQGAGELWKDLTPPFRHEEPNTNNEEAAADVVCPTTESRKRTVIHFCFLVHGLKGTFKDLAYLKAAMEGYIAAQERQEGTTRQAFVIHAVTAIEENSTDGIIHGGERVLQEMLAVVRREMHTRKEKSGAERKDVVNDDNNDDDSNDENAVDATISMVGNSLGGLFARYAVARLVELSSVESSSSFSSHSMGRNDKESNGDDIHDKNLGETILTLKEPEPHQGGAVPLSLRYRLGVYCSTAAPHLGVSRNSYVPLPRWAEVRIGHFFDNQSARDALWMNSSVVQDMALDKRFLRPLQYFSHRLAYINAYATDFMVPASTAGFLHPRSNYPHVLERQEEDGQNKKKNNKKNANGLIVARMTTPAEATTNNTRWSTTTTGGSSFHNNDTMTDDAAAADADNVLLKMSRSLDTLGWTKIFVDLRKVIPLNLPIWPRLIRSKGQQEKLMWTSQQVYRAFSAPPNVWWAPPLGHDLIVAVSDSPFAAFWNRGGRPIMDQLAMDLVNRLSQLVVVDLVKEEEVGMD